MRVVQPATDYIQKSTFEHRVIVPPISYSNPDAADDAFGVIMSHLGSAVKYQFSILPLPYILQDIVVYIRYRMDNCYVRLNAEFGLPGVVLKEVNIDLNPHIISRDVNPLYMTDGISLLSLLTGIQPTMIGGIMFEPYDDSNDTDIELCTLQCIYKF